MVLIRSTGAGSSPTDRRIKSTGAGSSPTDRILWGRFGVIVKPPLLPSMVPHTSLTIRLQQKLDIHPEYIPDNTTMVSIRSTGAGSSPTERRIQSTGAGSSPADRILCGRFGVIFGYDAS